jgi:hypothetical protein
MLSVGHGASFTDTEDTVVSAYTRRRRGEEIERLYNNSVGLSSTTNPKPKGHPLPAQENCRL